MRPFVRWLSARVLPPLAYPVVRGPLRGKRFILRSPAGQGGGASVYLNMVEPQKTKALIGILKPGQVVFDIGANVGYYTILASQQVGPSGRVLAFEPFVRNISYLHRHVSLNNANNVTVVPVACAERNALERFEMGADCATGHLSTAPTRENGTSLIVATTTVDDIVNQCGLRPDVMKVDVEGAEERVLLGAAKTLEEARPIVLLGAHSPALRRACTAYLSSFGYPDPAVYQDDDEGDTELLFMPPAPPEAPASDA